MHVKNVMLALPAPVTETMLRIKNAKQVFTAQLGVLPLDKKNVLSVTTVLQVKELEQSIHVPKVHGQMGQVY